MRHAQVNYAEGGVGDKNRPLDEVGIRDAAEMGQRLHAAAFEPDLVLTSSVTRAAQTALALAREFGLPDSIIEARDDLYSASCLELVEVMRCIDDVYEQVAIVGHHPGITDLATHLTDGRVVSLPFGGVVWMGLDVESWSETDRGRALHYRLEVP
jgi:phosphohistidine phosphatase